MPETTTKYRLESETPTEELEEKGKPVEEEPEETPEEKPVEEEQTKADKQDRLANLARSWDWKDKDEWEGPPDKWVDEETFVRRQRDITDSIAKANRANQLHNKALEGEIKSLKSHVQKLTKIHTETSKSSIEAKIADLERAFDDAVEEGDKEAAREIRKQINNMPSVDVDDVYEPTDTKPIEPPEISEWKETNKWYGADEKLTRRADAIWDRLRNQYPGLTAEDYLSDLDKEMKQFIEPENEPNKRRAKPSVSTVETNGRRRSGNQPKGITVADVKANADWLSIAKRGINSGYFKDLDDYVAKSNLMNEE